MPLSFIIEWEGCEQHKNLAFFGKIDNLIRTNAPIAATAAIILMISTSSD